jgi:hypothetical protein
VDQDFQDMSSILEPSLAVYYAYMVLSLVALSKWMSPLWVFPAAILACINFGLQTFADTRFCFSLASLPVTPVVFEDDEQYSGNLSSAIAFYNIVRWCASLIVTLVLLSLACSAYREGKAGTLFSAPVSALSWAEQLPQPAPQQQQRSGGFLARAAQEVQAFYFERFMAVPTRHIFASLLSAIGLLLFAINIAGFLSLFYPLIKQYHTDADDPNFTPQPDDLYGSIITILRLF